MNNREFSIISSAAGIELIYCDLYPGQDAYTNQIRVAIIEKKDFVLQEGIFHFCSMRKSKEEDTYLLNKKPGKGGTYCPRRYYIRMVENNSSSDSRYAMLEKCSKVSHSLFERGPRCQSVPTGKATSALLESLV